MEFIFCNIKTSNFTLNGTHIIINKGKLVLDSNDTFPGLCLGVESFGEMNFDNVYGAAISVSEEWLVGFGDKPIGMITSLNFNSTTNTVKINRTYPSSFMHISASHFLQEKSLDLEINRLKVCSGKVIEYSIKRVYPECLILEEITIYNDHLT